MPLQARDNRRGKATESCRSRARLPALLALRERLDLLFATINSYLSRTQLGSTTSLWRALWENHTWLAAFFRFDPAMRKLVRRYLPPAEARRASEQYCYFRRQFPEAVVLLKVGRFFEFYERRDAALARTLDLKPMHQNPRGARYGFPVAALRAYLPRLLTELQSVMLIAECDEYLTAIKTRLPVSRYEPLPQAILTLKAVAAGSGRCDT